jgi:adenylosuccinate lyase
MIMSSNEFNEVSEYRHCINRYELISNVSQVAEPFVPHRGASSTMPQKRNPISSEIILAQSKILRAQAGLVLDGMVSDFERASGPWHLEWAALPVAFISVVGSLYQANFALSGLQVNSGAMKANLESTRGLIVAEAVMMKLAEFIGRQEAHEVVYGACVSAIEGNLSLIESLQKIEQVTKHLSTEQLTSLVDPTQYLGCCQLMVDDLLRVRTSKL